LTSNPSSPAKRPTGRWAASLSVLSALLYTVTGNFYASTYGLLALLAAVSFGCCTRLLLARGLKLSGAFSISALLLTFPTVFWKTIQFTSMAVYIPCLLVALWATLRVWRVGQLQYSSDLLRNHSETAVVRTLAITDRPGRKR